MSRLALNKSSLQQENARLKTFERFLPSLDLKRRQLIAERARAARQCAATEAEMAAVRDQVGSELPMLGNRRIELERLVWVERVETREENLLGTRLPRLVQVEIGVRSYPLLGLPHWVDGVAARLRQLLELRVRLQIEQARLQRLEVAVQKVTQRVNLFDKVLIPRTRENIRRIRIYLSDTERAGVVRAKIAKSRHADLATEAAR